MLHSNSFVVAVCCHLLLGVAAAATGEPLKAAAIWDADAMNNTIVLDLEWLEVDPFGTEPFLTRTLGGTSPGPTILVSAGTTLRVKFRNRLTEQADVVTKAMNPNSFHDPDHANLHFHGPHITGLAPGDDTEITVKPGEEYDYVFDIPENHMPGMHWVHTHHHGSVALHLGGGIACAFIVKDPANFLPEEIAQAEEKIMIFQDWDTFTLIETARSARDAKFLENLEISGNVNFATLNGQVQPTLQIEQGVWQRWRMLYAGWQDLALNFKDVWKSNLAGCEFQLLAKDGIYLEDFPRDIGDRNLLPLPPGGRADVMVRCQEAGASEFQVFNQPVLTVISTASSCGDEFVTARSTACTAPLTPWTPAPRPDYLIDLQNTPASPGCACHTELAEYDIDSNINGKKYQPGNFVLHTSYLGAVVEREISNVKEHSYHQHVHPFQLIDSFKTSDYFRYGDWHDSIMDDGAIFTVRYQTTVFPGKIMVHCHNALHSDHGMLTKEYVRNVTDGECECDVLGPMSGAGILDWQKDDSSVVGGDVVDDPDAGLGDTTSAGLTAGLGFCTSLSALISLLF